jgi:tetratricopeptide (TPR) repeat protein
MNRTMRTAGTLLGAACNLILCAALCEGETGSASRPGFVGPVPGTSVPSYEGRALGRSLPIEGGKYYYELGEVHKRYGVYDKAIEMFQQAIEKEAEIANKSRYYESLSEVYQMKGEPKKAMEQIKHALSGAKTVEEQCRYNNILGRIGEQSGDTEGARKAYEFVMAHATRDAQKRSAQLSLFRLYQKSGELEKVIADLEEKLKEDPGDEATLDMLAQIFNSVVRDSTKALPVYERLSKLKPTDIPTLNRLVYLYQSDKQYEKAAEAYQQIIEASPSPNKGYYYQHVSRMYMLAGKKDEAVQWAEKSLSQAGARPYTYVSVGQIYLQNGLPEKAIELYERAMEACQGMPEKQQITLRFADVFSRNDKEEKAEELYKKVMEEATVASFKSQAKSKLIALYRKQGRTAEVQALTEDEEKAAPNE